MTLVCVQDLGDLGLVLFPRATHRLRRVLLAYRAARSRRRRRAHDAAAAPVTAAPPPRPWLRVDPALLAVTAFASDPTAAARARAVRIEGLEHLDAALARGKGVIMWLGPFGKQALGTFALIERGYPIVQLHGRWHGASPSWFGQRVIRPIHHRLEARLVDEIITMDDRSLGYLRRVVDRLRSNKIVCLPALGQDGNKFIAMRFLDQTRYFPTGAMTLARQTDAALISAFSFTVDGVDRLVLSRPLPVRDVEKGDRGLIRLAHLYVAEVTSHLERHADQWWGWPSPPARIDQLTILHDDAAELHAP